MKIEARGIGKRFGGLQALHRVSLVACSGEVTAVIGPNGAGKSTLLDCLSGLTAMDCGELSIGGTAYTRILPEALIKMGITRTFQNIRLSASLSAEEHVILARMGYARSGRAKSRESYRTMSEQARRLLKQVGLQRKEHYLPSQLSYGERRRLEIARGLATEPYLFLLDEPAAGTTPSEQVTLAETMELIAATGPAIILVEHHIDLVARLSKRVLVLNFGQELVTGPIEEIRNDPAVILAYLGLARK
jgi:branched-chain amino acid transport system ATP-binding protein